MMSGGNAWKYRPERQARIIADMGNPEWVRRRELYRTARGKFLGHFDKKRLVADWNVEWNLAGRPRTQPDFPEWLELNRDRLLAKRDEDRRLQQRINEAHAAYLAGRPA